MSRVIRCDVCREDVCGPFANTVTFTPDLKSEQQIAFDCCGKCYREAFSAFQQSRHMNRKVEPEGRPR